MGVKFPDGVVFFDIESHSLDERYSKTPKEYFRLGGYSFGESDEVHITESYDVLLRVLESAQIVVGHNISGFDLSVLYGPASTLPLIWARSKRVFDTLVHATLVNPAPEKYINKDGKEVLANEPSKARRWFSLDNQAYQLGVPGKSMDLADLAEQASHRYEPSFSEKTGKRLSKDKKVPLDVCCGYGHIPLDDPTFRDYLRHDVLATRHVARKLLEKGPLDDYAWREQYCAAINAQISRNGIRVDKALVDARMYEQDWTTAHILDDLHHKYGLPLEGKKPLATKIGKESLSEALIAVGIYKGALATTDTGAPSYSGDSIRIAAGWEKNEDGRWAAKEGARPDALELSEAVATLAGTRTLPELVKESLHPDGRVHPDIVTLQRSARSSTTKPGLTIFDNSHKDYFLSDSEDSVLVEFDLEAADARAVAAFSGDHRFAERFEPGKDSHTINAIVAWGEDVVATNPKYYRKRAKAPGHGWAYRIGKNKLSKTTGLPVEEAATFLSNMNKSFKGVVAWQERICSFARQHGYVIGIKGRQMPVEPSRMYNQPPALMGQNFTTEVIRDGLIGMGIEYLQRIKLTIHDAVLFDLPKQDLDKHINYIQEHMTRSYHPKGGLQMDFPVAYGPAGRTWKDADHG